MHTTDGTVQCETVVNCAGQWARQVGAMAGINVPLQPVKHQYIVTEKIEGLASDAPTIRDPDRLTYFKEEVGGLVMGGYEQNPIAWTTGDVPDDFQFRLFDDDWDHFEQHLTQAIARVPALETAGVRQMINGPESFTPDGNFILGVAPECANMFVGAGFNAFGIASGGGAGWVLATWAATGEAPMDLWVVDIRRFSGMHRRPRLGEGADARGLRQALHRSAFRTRSTSRGRQRIVSPLYERLKAHGAVFGSKLGWERPNWFAPKGVAAEDVYSMGRQNWFEHVGDEHRLVRESVGLFDQSSFAKYEIAGPGAVEALSWIGANSVDKPVGPADLHADAQHPRRHRVRPDRRADRRRPLLHRHRHRLPHPRLRVDQGPHPRRRRRDAHRRHRAVRHAVADGPARPRRARRGHRPRTSRTTAFPFGHVRIIPIAGTEVRALRVTYVGELGWELHIPLDKTGDVFDALMDGGQAATACGRSATARSKPLRLEKGYRAWGSDITPNDTPLEAGLGWAVKLKKDTPFMGRAALEAASNKPQKKMLATFTTEREDVVLLGRETILRDGAFAGYLTSGGYGYTIGKPIGLGYLRNPDGVTDDWARSGRYELVVAGETVAATVTFEPLYDPTSARVKA